MVEGYYPNNRKSNGREHGECNADLKLGFFISQLEHLEGFKGLVTGFRV